MNYPKDLSYTLNSTTALASGGSISPACDPSNHLYSENAYVTVSVIAKRQMNAHYRVIEKNNQYFSIVHQQSSLTQSLEPISFKPNAYHHAKEITISCNRMQPVYIIITMTNL